MRISPKCWLLFCELAIQRATEVKTIVIIEHDKNYETFLSCDVAKTDLVCRCCPFLRQDS